MMQVDLTFIHAYLEAKDECKRTGKPTKITGYPGWKVSQVKREDFED